MAVTSPVFHLSLTQHFAIHDGMLTFVDNENPGLQHPHAVAIALSGMLVTPPQVPFGPVFRPATAMLVGGRVVTREAAQQPRVMDLEVELGKWLRSHGKHVLTAQECHALISPEGNADSENQELKGHFERTNQTEFLVRVALTTIADMFPVLSQVAPNTFSDGYYNPLPRNEQFTKAANQRTPRDFVSVLMGEYTKETANIAFSLNSSETLLTHYDAYSKSQKRYGTDRALILLAATEGILPNIPSTKLIDHVTFFQYREHLRYVAKNSDFPTEILNEPDVFKAFTKTPIPPKYRSKELIARVVDSVEEAYSARQQADPKPVCQQQEALFAVNKNIATKLGPARIKSINSVQDLNHYAGEMQNCMWSVPYLKGIFDKTDITFILKIKNENYAYRYQILGQTLKVIEKGGIKNSEIPNETHEAITASISALVAELGYNAKQSPKPNPANRIERRELILNL